MMKLRSVTAGLLATAMLATSAAPAMAQGYPGGGYGRAYPGGGYGRAYPGGGYNRGWHRRDHDNTGAVVAGVIGVGILAAIIASASSSKNRSNGTYDNRYGTIRTDDQAADACATAAEQQLGNGARTRSVDSVDRVSDGFNVRGTVGNSNGRYDDRRDTRSFSCSVRYGDVQRVDFGGYAYNGY